MTLDFDGTITVTNCLTITKNVTIDGSGHAVTISGGSNTEVFAVETNATLLLKTLTIADGLSVSPGAITNGGILTVFDCIFSNNSSQPGGASALNALGGAIINVGTLLVSNSSFIQNSAVGEFEGGPIFGEAIMPPAGGAIYNIGNATITECTFSGNNAIGGDGIPGGGPDGDATSGSDALGGAIFNGGSIIVSNSTFVQNFSSGGAGGLGGESFGSGRNEVPVPGASGGNGYGGALYSTSGTAIVVNSTFLSNSAAGGAGGIGGNYASPFPGFSGNGANGGNGGNGNGGAIWVASDWLFITNVTFEFNTSSGASGGAGGSGTFPSGHGAAGSAGLAQGETLGIDGIAVAKNSIFCAQSSETNFFGSVEDAGYNLASDQSSSLTNATSRNGIDPLLGTLGYYGGNTQTIPLLLGSPAINGGDPNAFPPVDQRGRPRPSGPAPDIGAFEYTFPTFGTLSVSNSGAHFVLLGEAGDTSVIDASSNLVDWITLTTNSFGITNAIMILDSTAPVSGGRYYRARLQ